MAEDVSGSHAQGSDLDEAAEANGARTRRQRRSLVAFIVTVAVVVGVVAMLPIAMASELRGQATDHVFDLLTGADVDASEAVSADAAFVNITVTGLEEAPGRDPDGFRASRLSGDLPADHRHVLFAGE